MMRILNDGEFDEDDNVRKNFFIYEGQLRKILIDSTNDCRLLLWHLCLNIPTSKQPRESTRLSMSITSMHDFESNQNVL